MFKHKPYFLVISFTAGLAGIAGCGAPGAVNQGQPASAGVSSTSDDGGTAANPSAPVGSTKNHGASHTRCGWMYTTDATARAAFLANIDWYEAIHPDWYAMNPDGVSVRPILGTDDAAILAAALAHGVDVVPLVASVENADYTRAMMRDPAKRAAHIQTLVDLATQHHYPGLDLDYEQLWNPSDGPLLATFIKEFGAAMHAAGKRASMAVPAIDQASTVWDYAALSAVLDDIHIMGYDFHPLGGHAGPTAPLGWIDTVSARAQATGHPERFIMAIPNYGMTAHGSCVLSLCASDCQAPPVDTTDHMNTCPNGVFAAGRIKNCDSADGRLYYDDVASLDEKVTSAASHQLRGIGYWMVGGEPAGFFDMVRKRYP